MGKKKKFMDFDCKWYLRIFRVTEYEFEVNISKFVMADPISWLKN